MVLGQYAKTENQMAMCQMTFLTLVMAKRQFQSTVTSMSRRGMTHLKRQWLRCRAKKMWSWWLTRLHRGSSHVIAAQTAREHHSSSSSECDLNSATRRHVSLSNYARLQWLSRTRLSSNWRWRSGRWIRWMWMSFQLTMLHSMSVTRWWPQTKMARSIDAGDLMNSCSVTLIPLTLLSMHYYRRRWRWWWSNRQRWWYLDIHTNRRLCGCFWPASCREWRWSLKRFSMFLYLRPVADGVVISTDHDGPCSVVKMKPVT